MWIWVALGLLVLGLFLTLVTAMRTKNPRALALVRRFNRRFNNPRMLRHAGEPGSRLAVIRQAGQLPFVRLFGVNDFLVLRRALVTSVEDPPTA